MNALELADELEDEHDPWPRLPAAAELRRLSIENEAFGLHLSERMKDLARVEAQRDALLEALKEIHQATMRNGIVLAKCVGINAVAGMAIAKAEGEKNGQA